MGELNQETGILMHLKQLKEIIETKVEVRFDHKNLNLDCPEFIDKIPTAENICIEIYKIMRKEIAPELDVQIRLYETARNYVEYPV